METTDDPIDISYENDQICSSIRKISSFDYLDILDEVDEILRTKNKLIYAVGTQEALPSIESRVNVLQGLLDVCSSSQKVKNLLSNSSLIQGEIEQTWEKFKEFRIIPGNEFERIEGKFIRTLVAELIDNPPFELQWLKGIRTSKEMLIRFVTVPDVTAFLWDNFEAPRDDILAMRGFLAGGLFVHCLKKRNRVDYGINRVGGKKKMMAVPFRACETPSLRAEFGHPDCALMYTCLSYYYDGLSAKQVKEAFSTLLLLGESAKESIYKEWLSFFTEDGKYQHRNQNLFDNVRKLDLTNTTLVSQLTNHFHKNMKMINFWLNYCVFPKETMQFPYQLQATAWDIAHNFRNQVAGFSGTNDEKLLMPSSLEWTQPNDDQLLGTDGKMLHLLQKSDLECISTKRGRTQWKVVLDAVIHKANTHQQTFSRTCCALIDAGALMAGAADNEEVAKYLAANLKRPKGIVYFNIARNGWWVRDKVGREWPKHSSPIHERDGFVYFDDSRTRGADMKLNSDSSAVLTLGPNMCKDKLMQAAGRMRMLEHGQKLCLYATEEIVSKIRSVSNLPRRKILEPIHVLKWVIKNSVESIAKWLPEWAIQGGCYCIKEAYPELAFIESKNTLEEMYETDLREKPVCRVWEEKRRFFLDQAKDLALSKQKPTTMSRVDFEEINRRISCYGKDSKTKLGSSLEEECERELEAEKELQIEIEKEIPTQSPYLEKLWNVEAVLSCNNPRQLKTEIRIKRLGSFVAENIFFEENLYHVISRNFHQLVIGVDGASIGLQKSMEQ